MRSRLCVGFAGVMAVALFGQAAFGGAEHENGRSAFLPDIGLSAETMMLRGHEVGYNALLRRAVELDLFRHGNFVVTFHWKDQTALDGGPRHLSNGFEYLGLNWDTPIGRWTGFCRHTCNHTVGTPVGDQLRWTELGVGFTTHGMRLGHEDRGLPEAEGPGLEWLLRPQCDLSLATVTATANNEYDFRARGRVRQDFLRMEKHIGYVQAAVDLFRGSGDPYGYSVEIGDRVRWFRKVDLWLFLGYERKPDVFGADTRAAHTLMAGTRLTTLSTPNLMPDALSLPELAFAGTYGSTFDDSGSGGDTQLAVNLRRSHRTLIRMDGSIRLLTGGDLTPKCVVYEVGPTIRNEGTRVSMDLTYHYVSRHDANRDEEDYRSYHLVRVGTMTNGMDTRWQDERIDFGDPGFAGLNVFNRMFGVAGMVGARNYRHEALIEAGGRWDAARYGRNVLYGSLLARCFLGGGGLLGYEPEIGWRWPGKLGSVGLYLAHNRNIDPIRYDRNDDRTTLGVRVAF